MDADPRVVRPAPIDLVRYTPDLPEDDWAHIRTFVILAADDAIPRLTYAESSVVNAIAHHVDWCVNVAGYSMTRETIFRRDVISASSPRTVGTSTSGWMRSSTRRGPLRPPGGARSAPTTAPRSSAPGPRRSRAGTCPRAGTQATG